MLKFVKRSFLYTSFMMFSFVIIFTSINLFGIKNVYAAEDDSDVSSPKYPNINDNHYYFGYNNHITYTGTPIPIDDLEYSFDYKDKSDPNNPVIISPDVTYKYSKWDDITGSYGPYQDGLPTVGGRFDVMISGVSPYYGTRYTEVVINDAFDIGRYGISSNSYIYYRYTGKTIDPKTLDIDGNILFDYDTQLKSRSIHLTYGVDYDVIGYTYYNVNIKSPEEFASIKILPGMPVEKGDYFIILEGKGRYHGRNFTNISIMGSLDFNAITLDGDLSASKQKITTYTDRYVFYRFVPSETGQYIIYSAAGLKCKYHIYLYDKYGSEVDMLVGSGSKNQDAEKNDFYIIANLKSGEDYYFALRTEFSDYQDLDTFEYHTKQKSSNVEINIYKVGSKNDNNSSNNSPDSKKQEDKKVPTALKKGATFTSGKLIYKVTNSSSEKNTVSLYKNKNKNIKSVTIPKNVVYKGVTYKVTSIESNAFKGCKKLKKIIIKSLNIKKIGKNAFKGINKKAVFIVPKDKKTAYKKLLRKSNYVIPIIKTK